MKEDKTAAASASKMRQTKIIIWIMAALIILTAAGIGIYTVMYRSSYVATLGGEPMKVADYKFYFYQIVDNVEYGRGISNAEVATKTSFWLSQTSDGITYAEFYKDLALKQLRKITASMIKAKKSGMQVEADTKTAYDKYMNDIVTNKFAGSKINADKAMIEQYGSPLDTIKQILLDQELAYSFDQSYYNSRVAALKTSVTYDEAKAKYDESPASYNTFNVRHILILTLDPSTGEALPDDQVTAAQTKANELKTRIEAGENMVDLVTNYSQDKSKSNGGTFSFNKLATNIDPALLNWVKTAEIGKVSVVKTQSGYSVIVLEKSDPTKFEDITDGIKTEIASIKTEDEIAAFADEFEMKMNNKVYSKISAVR